MINVYITQTTPQSRIAQTHKHTHKRCVNWYKAFVDTVRIFLSVAICTFAEFQSVWFERQTRRQQQSVCSTHSFNTTQRRRLVGLERVVIHIFHVWGRRMLLQETHTLRCCYVCKSVADSKQTSADDWRRRRRVLYGSKTHTHHFYLMLVGEFKYICHAMNVHCVCEAMSNFWIWAMCVEVVGCRNVELESTSELHCLRDGVAK